MALLNHFLWYGLFAVVAKCVVPIAAIEPRSVVRPQAAADLQWHSVEVLQE